MRTTASTSTFVRLFTAGLLASAVLASTAFADDVEPTQKKKDGKRNPASQIIKQLKNVTLTPEQQAKLRELAKKSTTEMRKIRQEAKITPDVMKKRSAAAKELRGQGKKGEELIAAINEKSGLTAEQAAALKKSDALRTGLMKAAIAMLSDEQKADVPKRLLMMANGKMAKEAGKKGKGKKKDVAKTIK